MRGCLLTVFPLFSLFLLFLSFFALSFLFFSLAGLPLATIFSGRVSNKKREGLALGLLLPASGKKKRTGKTLRWV